MLQRVRKKLSGFLAILMVLSACIGSLGIAPVSVSAAADLGSGPIDVWDFGGVLEPDGSMYTNHIQAEDWNSLDQVSDTGKFVAVDGSLDLAFGDLNINYVANDRLYIADEACKKTYGTWGNTIMAFEDGYTSNGTYYCNGTAGAPRRNITVSNVTAGDRITVYMGTSNAVEYTMGFQYIGDNGEQLEKRSASKVGKFEFVAEYDGSYKIYTETDNGAKPVYYRVVRTPGVEVSGTIDLGTTGAAGYNVYFTNKTTGQKTQATVDGTNYSVRLAPGYTYTAALSGVTGVGFTNDSKVVTVEDIDTIAGKKTVTLQAEEKKTYQYSGSVTGFAQGYDTSNLKVVLMPTGDTNVDPVTLKLDENLGFTATCEPDVEYDVQLSGVNDYDVTEGGIVNSSVNLDQDIVVAKKAMYEVSGKLQGGVSSANVTKLTFVNEEDQYSYEGTVTENGYTVALRDGAYSVKAEAEGYTTNTHVVVKGKDVTKDLLFVTTDTTVTPIPHVSDIYVGYADKENNYKTVREAVAACKAMKPTSEEERITVHIAPGTYREQIIINTPYITFVNDDPKQEVKLTWYYGIGYKYYSCDKDGYYNEENAFDEYSKQTPAKWGCAVYAQSGATGFRAQNIVFEASFNRYITDEELADGVELTGNENISVERKYGLDVASKKATERAAALCNDADQSEFLNCTFLGSQDTLYTGGYNTSSYYKNCVIEGNTDYIFGDGDVVFDGCELKWYGYTANSASGFITAARPAAAQNGYVFRNCSITGNENEKYTVTPSYFGRPWGANAKVAFVNTKIQDNGMIDSVGWMDMSGNVPEKAAYTEYNSTYFDGTAVDTTNRVTGVVNEDPAIQVATYFGEWTPSFFAKENETLAFTTKPYLIDNGDINAPYPGHTLTACYSLGDNDANDASVLSWYRVSADGSEKLVKSATAITDKTYTITKQDQGSTIKVVVTPETVSGTKTEAQSYQLEATVREGYDNPDAEEGDVELGDGVNIFLAGDSTVKDYSVNGMYNGGTAQNMGSWGEYLQSYFDKDKVTVVNYANGGRSSRNFMNEGSLDKIKDKIGEGDYLFIQFGHNDCANGQGYLEDRYVPLGTPDANGVYPTTEAKKVSTPSSLLDKYGEQFYSYDCGGTYKWYLLQYIKAAKEKGAIPVLVTPVSRLYYNADGTIKPHHDATDTTTATEVSTNNAYVTAVKQLAKEQGVLLVDGFTMTKDLYETTYKEDQSAAAGVSPNATLLMADGDKTHSSKLGGFISAGLFAQQIKSMNLSISKAVKEPQQVSGENTNGEVTFVVNGKHEFTANGSAYWTEKGQALLTMIGTGNAPEVTVSPEPTKTPEVTVTPEPTKTPEVTVTPEPTKTPEATTTPAPTKTPSTSKPTATPTVKPTQTPSVKVDKVTKVKVKTTTANSMDVSWKEVKGANGYQVVVYKGSKQVAMKSVSSKYTKVTMKKLADNTSYRVRVCAYKTVNKKAYYGAYSDYVSAKTKLKTPSISVKKGTKKATVSWKKVSGAKGYEVVMSTKKNSGYKKVKTIQKSSAGSTTVTKLKSKKTYYFKVRAYQMVNGKKVYSEYSAVKSVKVK